MRKPRDFDAELKALGDKAKELKERKLRQLGELVQATCADALDVEELAGALLAAVDCSDRATRDAWRKRGATFFQRPARRSARSAGRNANGNEAGGSSTQSAAGEASAS